MPAFQLIMHSHKDVSLKQFQANACLFYNIAKQPFIRLFLGILWNVTLVLKAKALEDALATWLWHYSVGLGFGICSLTACVCLMANPLKGHDVCDILTGRPHWCLLARGAGTIFLLLGQAAPLPFFSLPLPSRFPPLPIPSFRNRPLLLLFPFHSLPM